MAHELLKRAFITVSDKTGIVDFARDLRERGIELFSAGGTAKLLQKEGVDVADIADFRGATGSILNHGLLTLQPVAHAPLLTMRTKEHDAEIGINRWPLSYDLLVIDCYDFDKARAEYQFAAITIEQLREQIDVGGPSLIMSASKRMKFPLVAKSQRKWFLSWFDKGCPDFERYRDFAIEAAVRAVAHYRLEHSRFMCLWNEVMGRNPEDDPFIDLFSNIA